MAPLHRIPVRAALGLAVLLGTPVVAHAQDEGRPHSLEAGRWALLFSVGPDFQLGSFDGSSISIKHHGSPGRALELALSPTLSMLDVEDELPLPDSLLVRGSDERFAGLAVELHWVRYPRPGSDVNLFHAFGPELGWSRSSYEHSSSSTEHNRVTWSAGVGARLGAEWFAWKAISLHAAYGTSLRYSSERRTDASDLEGERVTRAKRWTFGGEGVRFGASVYL